MIDTTGQVLSTAVTVMTGATVRMDAGTLRTNGLSMNGSGTFDWRAGTLSTYSPAVIGSGSDASAYGGAYVFQGRELVVTGNLTTGASSVLDLGDLYTAGATVYNLITITGTLNLSAAGDTFKMFSSPYLLRASNGGVLSDSGTLALVTATGGITGTFDNLLLPASDGRPFDLYTGFWPLSGNPANLPVNTFYVEQTATQILLHYNVSSAIPEPATGGLVLAGVMGLRVISSARRRRQEGEGSRGAVSLARWARSARRRFRRHS
ncbi:MAG: PEP-CTERM sorting domain-containing protein [Kiritimatiellia bacterium]